MKAMEVMTVAGPQGALAVYRAGAGPGVPALFVHADSGRASQWFGVMSRVANARPVVAFDFRGHGDSEPAADGDYTYGGRAADIAAVADAQALKRFVLVAHSGGGGAALEYAGAHPDRVVGLFLTDPASDPRSIPQDVRDGFIHGLQGPQSLEVLQGYYSSIAGANPTIRARVLEDAAAVHPAARLGVAEALAEWNPEAALQAWPGPTMIVSSPIGDVPGALYRMKDGLRHEVIADVGHWVQVERPDTVARLLDTFIKELETGKRR